jgi:hypothetical protein
MTTLGEFDLEMAAKQAAGNWQRFPCFCWHRANRLEDPECWAILYTHHRDSGLLDLSNADVIRKALEPFTEADPADVMPESHNHWAVGWIDGYAVRVYRDGQITEAFGEYHRLAERLSDYPILDEEDYSRREHETTLANITDAARFLPDPYQLPEGWEGEACSWFWEHDQGAVENRDDQGGYPTGEQLEGAFQELGYRRVEG